MSDLKIHYETVDLDSVADYFVRGYSKAGGEIEHHEFFVDVAKGKMIFKLYVRDASPIVDSTSDINNHGHGVAGPTRRDA